SRSIEWHTAASVRSSPAEVRDSRPQVDREDFFAVRAAASKMSRAPAPQALNVAATDLDELDRSREWPIPRRPPPSKRGATFAIPRRTSNRWRRRSAVLTRW